MHRRTLVTAGLISASLLFGACGDGEDRTAAPAVGAPSSSDLSEDPSTPKAGKPDAPDGGAYTDKYNFTATTFDGETFELAVHKGTPVVINFWESW